MKEDRLTCEWSDYFGPYRLYAGIQPKMTKSLNWKFGINMLDWNYIEFNFWRAYFRIWKKGHGWLPWR